MGFFTGGGSKKSSTKKGGFFTGSGGGFSPSSSGPETSDQVAQDVATLKDQLAALGVKQTQQEAAARVPVQKVLDWLDYWTGAPVRGLIHKVIHPSEPFQRVSPEHFTEELGIKNPLGKFLTTAAIGIGTDPTNLIPLVGGEKLLAKAVSPVTKGLEASGRAVGLDKLFSTKAVSAGVDAAKMNEARGVVKQAELLKAALAKTKAAEMTGEFGKVAPELRTATSQLIEEPLNAAGKVTRVSILDAKGQQSLYRSAAKKGFTDTQVKDVMGALTGKTSAKEITAVQKKNILDALRHPEAAGYKTGNIDAAELVARATGRKLPVQRTVTESIPAGGKLTDQLRGAAKTGPTAQLGQIAAEQGAVETRQAAVRARMERIVKAGKTPAKTADELVALENARGNLAQAATDVKGQFSRYQPTRPESPMGPLRASGPRVETTTTVTDWVDAPAKAAQHEIDNAVAKAAAAGRAYPTEARDLGAKVIDRFKTMREAETKAGILPNWIEEGYVTRLYEGTPEAKAALSKWAQQERTRMWGTSHRFTKEREIATMEKARELGLRPITDVAQQLFAREMAHIDAMTNVQLRDYLAKNFPQFVKDAKSAPAGWRAVESKGWEGMRVHPDLEQALAKVNGILADDAQVQVVLNAIDRLTNIYKRFAVLRPGFHTENLAGNAFNMYLADFDFTKLPEYLNVVTGKAQAAVKLTPQEVEWFAPHGMVNPDGTMDAIAYMKVKGVTGRGQFSPYGMVREFAQKSGLEAGGKKWNPLSKDFALSQKSLAVGQSVEDTSRAALFLDGLEKGLTNDEAVARVQKYLFDYDDLTPFEQQVRRFALPWYTWLRKNTALQLESLVTKPWKYQNFSRVRQATEQFGTPTEDRQYMPGWQESNSPFKLPFDIGGKPSYATMILPVNDLNRLNVRDIAGQGNPVGRVPVELLMGKTFRGRSLPAYPGEKSLGLPKTWAYPVEQLLGPVRTAQRVMQAGTPGEIGREALQWATDVNVLPFDAESEKLYQLRLRREALRKELNQLKKAKGK